MASAAEHKTRQLAQWGAAAGAWDRRFDWYSAAFRPLIDWIVEAAGIAPGMRVLDVGCGCGQPCLTAAERVGPTGEVVAVDLSRDMLLHAARRAQRLNFDQVAFHEMDAEDLHFEDGTFDAVTSACVLMFCPDANRAAAQMARMLKPGGRLSLSVWGDPAENPFVTLGGQPVAQFFPATPPDANAPNAFRFARAGLLEDVLRGTGLREVTVESRPMPIEFATPAEYWEVFLDLAAGARDKVASMSDADRAALDALVHEGAARYMREGRLVLTATLLCASARK